jgi:hypothetical protein
MKCLLFALVVCALSADVKAEETKYKVTGVFCKKYADLHSAVSGMYEVVYFADALLKLPDCFVINKHAVNIEAHFVAWLPAVWQKAFIYKANYNQPIRLDDGGLVSSPSGSWFFIPTAASGVPQPKASEYMPG